VCFLFHRYDFGHLQDVNHNADTFRTMIRMHRKSEDLPVVFVLAHSPETAQSAYNYYSQFPWAHPFYIPTTYYFETYFYSNMLGNILDQLNITNSRWVGSISWKTHEKYNTIIVDMMLQDKDKDIQADVDVLGFWNPVPAETLWEIAQDNHPGLMDLMVYILQSVGESQDHIEMMRLHPPAFKHFYGSYFVTRPNIMRLYIQWLSTVIHFINTDRKAQNMIWRNSEYGGDIGPARAVFDLPFYPHFPFLGERLIPYFFNSRGYKILIGREYSDAKFN